ncbi:MAG: DUF624 domain-containing protein [Ruminococcaceae bacterium]|nr:DUF624 domain-containing protein [Oscillospiraceae bacterium]
MNNVFDPDGKMMELLWKPIHIMLLNLLWVLFSLPVVTIGASTTALYSVLIKMKNGLESNLFRDFWDAFRQNFRQATVMWLLFLCAAFVFTTDIVFFLNMGGFFGTFFAMVFFGLDIILLMLGTYAFPMQATFDNKIVTTLKSALYLSFRHFGWTVVLLALGVLTFVVIWIFWISCFWIVFGLAAFINAGIFDKIFKRYYLTNTDSE